MCRHFNLLKCEQSFTCLNGAVSKNNLGRLFFDDKKLLGIITYVDPGCYR
jgi:hypothetical protein